MVDEDTVLGYNFFFALWPSMMFPRELGQLACSLGRLSPGQESLIVLDCVWLYGMDGRIPAHLGPCQTSIISEGGKGVKTEHN